MGLTFYLEAFLYIPYSILNLKEFKNNSPITSYAEGERRIKKIMLPAFYVCVLATIWLCSESQQDQLLALLVIPLFILTALLGMRLSIDIGILKPLKIRTCACGHLLTREDGFKYDVLKTTDDYAIVNLHFVCKECQKETLKKCHFTLRKTKQVTDYKDKDIHKIKSTGNPGEYELYTETKRVASGSHTETTYTNTVAGVIDDFFRPIRCFVTELSTENN